METIKDLYNEYEKNAPRIFTQGARDINKLNKQSAIDDIKLIRYEYYKKEPFHKYEYHVLIALIDYIKQKFDITDEELSGERKE